MEKSWTTGENLSAAELSSRYNIPRDEIESFREMMRIYTQGETIIREGDNDKTLFLLRHGVVNISKEIGYNESEHIAIIKAVNFFGEMSLINDNPRSATVEAYSDEAVVYAVGRPNVHLILTNPHWGEMLLSRLSNDLARTSNQLASTVQTVQEIKRDKEFLEKKLEEAQAEREASAQSTAKVLSALSEFQLVIQREAIVGSRGWAYLQALNRVTALLVSSYLPEIACRQQPADREVLKSCLSELGKNEPKGVYNTLINML
jgi:CRP-like cAMP-binding protein